MAARAVGDEEIFEIIEIKECRFTRRQEKTLFEGGTPALARLTKL